MRRAQSHVVGVALLLGVTVIALGSLTVAVGGLLDSQAAAADSQRVADGFADLEAVETTGHRTTHIRLTGGQIETAERTVRIYRNGSEVAAVDADALVFTDGDRRVTYLAGAVIRGRGGSAWLEREPPLAGSRARGVLAVGLPRLNASDRAVSGGGGASVPLETTVTHSRTDLGNGTVAVAIETATPGPFERHFRALNATVDRIDPDGDGVESIRAAFPGVRQGYLILHDLGLEVGRG